MRSGIDLQAIEDFEQSAVWQEILETIRDREHLIQLEQDKIYIGAPENRQFLPREHYLNAAASKLELTFVKALPGMLKSELRKALNIPDEEKENDDEK